MNSKLLGVVILLLVKETHSKGTGPPQGNAYTYCSDLRPGHAGLVEQPLNTRTVNISVAAQNDDSGKIVVTLTGEIGGFILQGRAMDHSRIGTFQAPSTDKAKLVANCDGGQSSMGHAKPDIVNTLTFTWVSPQGTGAVRFAATFVKPDSITTAWVNVTSDPIQYDRPAPSPGASSSVSAPVWLTAIMVLGLWIGN